MAGNHIPHGHPQRQKNLASFMQGSHVVDENNNPLRLYHGTADDFDEFKHGHMNKKDAGWLGRGFYFTNSPSLANSYAMIKRGKSENVMPVHLALKNPFYATTEHKAALQQALEEDPFAAEDFRNKLIDAGHDGVILDYGTPDKVREYVAFNPNQIKSAIGNRGTFDPTNPNITKADGGIVGDPDTDEGITAYHGSPHDFERFDMSKIGTGEGAQAYGHGLYFAQNENVAKGYRDALSEKVGSPQLRVGDKTYPVKGGGWADRKEELLHRLFKEAKIHRIDNQGQPLGQYSDEAIESELRSMRAPEELRRWAESELKGAGPIDVANPGYMYEVRINAHPDHFLDWDKPISEQTDYVKNAISAIQEAGKYVVREEKAPFRPKIDDNPRGRQLVSGLVDGLGGRKEASQHLRDFGIKGIKYLDAGSRGASDKPTNNYVVFDDKLVNVKRKYAKGGTVQRTPKPVSDGSIVTRALMLTSKKA